MSKNKIIIYTTIVVVLTLIIIPTIFTIVNNYNEKMYNSTIYKIENAATNCINDEVCKKEKITLKELYDNNYLEKMVNPVSKEYFSVDSYLIMQDDNSFKFHEK